MDRQAPDVIGQRFGRLVVLHEVPERHLRQRRYRCRCDCGTLHNTEGSSLRWGRTRSCGCLSREVASRTAIATKTKHGEAAIGKRTPEWHCWGQIIQRCTNPKNKRFKDWGGRGITVCDRWRNSYENFLADMGRRPSSEHSIDRFPDNDGPYSPENCRWATRKEQAEHKRPWGTNRIKEKIPR